MWPDYAQGVNNNPDTPTDIDNDDFKAAFAMALEIIKKSRKV
jgi:hypothetical protein